MEPKIAVVGLGYVGLPLALAFAAKYRGVVGFDLNEKKVASLQLGVDPGKEVATDRLKNSSLRITADISDLNNSNFFVVGVPTPIDSHRRPDLKPLTGACRMIGEILSKGSTIVFESTVYPGVTEDICVPILEDVSGLKWKKDFNVGYSPERINPGDKKHTLEKITKVTSGDTAESAEQIASIYQSIIEAGVYRASSIKVAEAAKVIENTQRDLNIALMNELSIIFDKLNISTAEVLEAAGTKWNFLKFTPGLVGGHCIGVDPYYLTTKAEELGYNPQVILAGRRINDNMGTFIAQKVIKLLACSGAQIKGAKVGVLGLTFKENVSDIRNSRVPELLCELKEFGVDLVLHDPKASSEEVEHEYGFTLSSLDDFTGLDALIYAVVHDEYVSMDPAGFAKERVNKGGIFIDVKSAVKPENLGKNLHYWAL